MNFSAFYDDILTDCSRAPLPVALAAARSAAIELCRRSMIWQHVTDAEAAISGVATYELDLPDDTEPVQLLSAQYQGVRIEAKALDWLDGWMYDWRTLTGSPRYVTTEIPTEATLVPYPDTTVSGALRFRLALTPTRTATVFDPDGKFSSEFYETILHGAKARLLSSPSKPYTNLQLADHHMKQFTVGVNRARLVANRSMGRVEERVEIPRTI